MKITDKVFQSLETWGEDHPAYIELMPDKAPVYTSAKKLRDRIDDATDFLKKSGIQNNFMVVFFLQNSVDFVTTLLSLMDMGAKPIPVNLAFRKLELDEIFSNAEPHAVIAEEECLPIILPYLKNKIVILRSNGKFRLHQAVKNSHEPAQIDEAIASINYTYRGYGYPIGAMVPHAQYIMGAEVLEDGVKLRKGERLLVILPMQHIFTLIGCVFLPLLYHVTSVISHQRSPLRLFEFIQRYKIDNILAVPELYDLFLKLNDKTNDLSPLKAFLSGGSVLPEKNYARLMNTFNVDLIHGYGLTEFTPVSRNIRGAVRPGTIGRICDGLEHKISSPNKKGEGEIWIKTPHMAKSYYGRKKATEEAFENGWFKTGDIGRIEEGHLIFVKEKKHTGKLKGNMVDFAELEKAILSYPGIKDTMISLKDNILFADIKIDTDNNINNEYLNIKRYLENRLSAYKIPSLMNRI